MFQASSTQRDRQPDGVVLYVLFRLEGGRVTCQTKEAINENKEKGRERERERERGGGGLPVCGRERAGMERNE